MASSPTNNNNNIVTPLQQHQQTLEIITPTTTTSNSLNNNQQISNVKYVLFQPFVGDSEVDKMSLNTLLEAAKFLELQEQNQNGINAVATAPNNTVAGGGGAAAASVTGTVSLINEDGTQILQNGTSGLVGGCTSGIGVSGTHAYTLQPIKLLNTSTVPNLATTQALQPSTVVIANNSLPPAFLQGPLSLCTAATSTNGIIDDKNQNATLITQSNQPPQLQQQQQTSSSSSSSSSSTQSQPSLSTASTSLKTTRIYNNSFDIMNPLIIDESNPNEQKKIKPPPMPFRNGNRDVHNKLEKHRRAHLKECFEILKNQLPVNGKEKKASNLSILHSAVRYIHSLKSKKIELEQEMERLANEKILHQQQLQALKKDISTVCDNFDFSNLLKPPPTSSLSSSSPPPLPLPLPPPPPPHIITSLSNEQNILITTQAATATAIPPSSECLNNTIQPNSIGLYHTITNEIITIPFSTANDPNVSNSTTATILPIAAAAVASSSSSASSATSSTSSPLRSIVYDSNNKVFISSTSVEPMMTTTTVGPLPTTTTVGPSSIPITDLGSMTTHNATAASGGGNIGSNGLDCASSSSSLGISSIVNSNAVINQSNSSTSNLLATNGSGGEGGGGGGGGGVADSGGSGFITTTDANINQENKISIPILSKNLPMLTAQATSMGNLKEVNQSVQQTGISVVPMATYPVNHPSLVLQKVAIVPHKGLTELTPLVSTFYTAPQQLNGINGQINGKVVPLTQYLVKPVVVVSTANPPRPGS